MEGARVNIEAGLVSDVSVIKLGDSTLPKTLTGLRDVEVIATNPPYGMRSHNPKKLPSFYRALLRNLRNSYPGARMSAITAAAKTFREAAIDSGATILREFPVMHGGLWTKIFLLEL